MIGRREAAQWAELLGVTIPQIARDHLLSHVLAALPQLDEASPPVFVGGTALSRTYLQGLRVSEDLDLLVADERDYADRLRERLPRLLRRPYPDLAVGPGVLVPRGLSLLLTTGAAPSAEVQLLAPEPGDEHLDLAHRGVVLRYEGLPDTVEWCVPTAASFVALKLVSYLDRREPRDLFDLAHLADLGEVTARAAEIFARLTGAPPQPASLTRVPAATACTWHERLAHQTPEPGSPDDALRRLRQALERL